MTTPVMESTIQTLLEPGKGILATDESFPTIDKRFKALNISSNEENRGAYREMLATTAGLSEFISGVILLMRQIASGCLMHPHHNSESPRRAVARAQDLEGLSG
jgi:fructose-bisphosphate aldolase class 1